MKTSNWINLTALCFILSFTAACGDKNKSGGSNNNNNNNANQNAYVQADTSVLAVGIQNTTYGQETLSQFNRVKDWASREDSGRILSTFFSKGQVRNVETTQNCSTGTFLKFLKYEVCKNGSLSNQTVTFVNTPTHYCTIPETTGSLKIAAVTQQNLPIDNWTGGCSLSNYSYYSKDQNTELMNILTLNSGSWQLFGASTDRANYNLVYLLVGPNGGSPSKLYMIDMGFHSVYNPMAIEDLATKTTTKTLFLR